MPRIRSIKPEFFLDEDLARLMPLDRLIFVGLWCQADREGRLEDRPGRLKVQIVPYDDEDMDAALARLASAGFIVRYTVQARPYIQVRTFSRHQRPHRTEQPSVLPPCDNVATTVQQPLSHCSPTVEERSGKEEGMEEGKGKEEGMETQACPQERTSGGPIPRVLPSFVTIWNEVMDGSPLPLVRSWTPARDRLLKARLAEEGDLALWRSAMERLRDSPHHRGGNDRGWVADVEFFLRASQAPKWLDMARTGFRPAEPVLNGKAGPSQIMAWATEMEAKRVAGGGA